MNSNESATAKKERERDNLMISKLLFVFCINNCCNCYTIYHSNVFHNDLNAIIYKTEYINYYYMQQTQPICML